VEPDHPVAQAMPMSARRLWFLVLLCLVPAVARAAPITVPVDIGIGPAGHWISGVVGQDQLVHTGIRLSLVAIADHDLIMQHLDRVPKQYRGMAAQLDEYRYRPSILVPDTIILSPKVAHTGMYGATWRLLPIKLNLLPERTTRLDLDLSLLLTYTFLHSDTLPGGTMHFLRPGLDVGFEWTIPVLEDAFLVSLGYASQFYVPQAVGGPIFELPGDRPSIWHIAQVFLVLHWRVPYDVNL
jgi:hypothetical protein